MARIRNTVENEDITGLAKETEEWGGADLIVTSDPERAAKVASDNQPTIDVGPTGVSFSNERYTVVLTKYARELSWLIENLRDSLAGYVLDFMSKYEFYAILGKAANEYIENTPKQSQNARDLLLAVVNRAEELLLFLKENKE